MNLKEVIEEELIINTKNKQLNFLYRKTLKEIFSSDYLNKIDNYFLKGLTIKNIKRKNNVVAITKGKEVSVNSLIYSSLPLESAVMYLVHETFHVLQNINVFNKLKEVNDKLCYVGMKLIPKDKINLFLTGKNQDIHSDPTKEFLTYFSNNVFVWDINPNLKPQFKKIIEQAGIFNTNSNWWKKRIN
jgi:hypothetical protein